MANKKGQSMPTEWLGWTVLILAGLGVLLFIFYFAGPKFGSVGSEKACQLSIAAKVQAGVTGELFPVACRTQEIQLKGQQTEALAQISDLLASCENQFLNGNYNDVLGKTFSISSQNKCFVCYRFKGVEGVKISAKEDLLDDYLLHKNYANGQRYYDYLTNKDKVDFGFFSNIDDPEEEYAIAFSSKTGSNSWAKIIGGGAAVGGGIIVVLASGGILLPVVGGVAAAAGTYSTIKGTAELYQNHDKSVIYMDTFTNMKQRCAVQS